MRALWKCVRCIQTHTNVFSHGVCVHRELDLFDNELTSIVAGIFVDLPALK